MPTPSNSTTQLTSGADTHLERLTCPPESERSGRRRREDQEGPDSDDVADGAPSARQQDCAAAEIEAAGLMEDVNINHEPSPTQAQDKTIGNMNPMDTSTDGLSPLSTALSIATPTTVRESTPAESIATESNATESTVKESERSLTTTPGAETVDLSSMLSARWGIPNVRVC